MPNIKIKIEGINELIANLKKYPEIAGRETQEAIEKSIYEIHRNAIPITPVDTGRLRASLGAGISFSPLKGEIGSDLDYATKQHENEYYKHKIGEAKFLEKGVNYAMNAIEDYFLKALDNTMKKIAKIGWF